MIKVSCTLPFFQRLKLLFQLIDGDFLLYQITPGVSFSVTFYPQLILSQIKCIFKNVHTKKYNVRWVKIYPLPFTPFGSI